MSLYLHSLNVLALDCNDAADAIKFKCHCEEGEEVAALTIEPSAIQQLIHIAKAWDIEYLGLFGSVARNEARPKSDVDLAVRFARPISLLDIVSIRLKMEAVLGRPVDLIPIDSIYPFVRESMTKDLIVLYDTSNTKISLGMTAYARP